MTVISSPRTDIFFIFLVFQRDIKEKHQLLHSSFGSLQQFVIDEESDPTIKLKMKIKKEPVAKITELTSAVTNIPPVISTNFTATVPDDWASVVVKDEYEEYEISEEQHQLKEFEPKPIIEENVVQPTKEVESTLDPENFKLKLETYSSEEIEPYSDEELEIDSDVKEEPEEEHLMSRLEEVENPDAEELEIETILNHSNELVIKQSVKRRRELEEAKKRRNRTFIMNIETVREEDDEDNQQEEEESSSKRWKITYAEQTNENAYAVWDENRRKVQYKCEYCAIVNR